VLPGLVLSCVLPALAGAATIDAASCSYVDVSAAIESAAPEDTVLVPAGTTPWESTLVVTKGIALIGAGKGKTIINNARLRYEPSDLNTDYAFRLSGFSFHAAGCEPILHLGANWGQPTAEGDRKQTKIRIDHNEFRSACRESSGPLIWLHQVVSSFRHARQSRRWRDGDVRRARRRDLRGNLVIAGPGSYGRLLDHRGGQCMTFCNNLVDQMNGTLSIQVRKEYPMSKGDLSYLDIGYSLLDIGC